MWHFLYVVVDGNGNLVSCFREGKALDEEDIRQVLNNWRNVFEAKLFEFCPSEEIYIIKADESTVSRTLFGTEEEEDDD